MRGKVDENMPIEAADLLRAAGWDCDTVVEEKLGGAADPDIARRCQADGRVLFTLDTDFADIRAYPPGEHVGIVVLRLVKHSPDLLTCLS
jgi:predicted nuclease of predicted toxin-antitoxin system